MDRRTRQRNASQELVVFWSLFGAGTLALAVLGAVTRDWLAAVMGGLFTVSSVINIRAQVLRLRRLRD